MSLVVLFTVTGASAAAGVSMWRVHAQDRPLDAVRPAPQPPPATAPANAGDRGETYYWLESQALRETTRFADAIAIAERGADGDVVTRLTDLAGNELAALTVDRIAQNSSVVEYRPRVDRVVRAAVRPDVRPTLDWGNRQAYLLWKDRRSSAGSAVEWRGDFLRHRQAPAMDVDSHVVQTATEWPDALVAVTTPSSGPRRNVMTGQPARGRVLASRLRSGGLQVGEIRWYSDEQVLAWSYPGLTSGFVDPERLKPAGGWPLAPDPAWMNVQGYAFRYFHARLDGGAARAGTGPTGSRWAARLVEFFAPTVMANSPGCDGLHWLDRTVFRPCCDSHDRCYEKYGCNWTTWWTWWTSWSCTTCNGSAVFCFASGGYMPYRTSFP
jgi:hypothetical protein